MHLSIFLFVLLCGAYTEARKPLFRVELKKTKSMLEEIGESKPLLRTAILRKLDELYQVKKNGNASVPLFKYFDSQYYGEVLMGHPGQKMNMVFDTSWTDTWVISKLCPTTTVGCLLHNKYDSSRSSQYVPNGKRVSFDFGKYHLSGRLSTDLIHIGKVNVTNQTFAEVSDIPWIYAFMKSDGVIGMSFERNSPNHTLPIFYSMIKQGLVDKQIFSFYMNRDPSSTRAGTVFFGGVEPRHYSGNFTFANIIKLNFWEFEMEGIFVKGKNRTYCKGGCTAIADTSSNVIAGPDDEIEDINSAIGATQFHFGRYVIDCGTMDRAPTITFSISGRPFVLKARDYIQKISWGGFMICMSSFANSDIPPSFGPIWTLGGAFLSRFYVQFDLGNKRIGFADAHL